MKKLFKILIYLVLTIVVLVVIGIGAIVFFVNPNQFKPQITELVQKNANVILNIEGDLAWTFYPWLGIEVSGISVASPNTPTVPLASIEKAQVSVLLKSLINQELNISDVVIEGLSVSLLKDAKGNTNWAFASDDAASSVKTIEHKTTEVGQESPSKQSTSSPSLYVKSILVKNANVVYKDAQNNQAVALKDLTLQTGEVQLGQPIAVQLQAGYSVFNPKIEGDIEFSSVVDFKAAQQYLQLRNMNLKNSVAIDQTMQISTTIQGLLDFDLKRQLFQLSQFNMTNNGHVGSIPLSNIALSGVVKADLNRQIINVDDLALSTADLMLKGNVIAEQFMSDQLKLNGQLSTNTFDLAKLLKAYQVDLPQFSSPTALQKASLQLVMNGDLKNINLNPIAIQLDQTTMNGSAAVSLAGTPTVALALRGDQLIVDHYLPKASASAGKQTQSDHQKSMPKASDDPVLIPTLPATMNVIANIEWDRIQLDQLQMTQNRLKGSLKGGSATLDQLSTNIYGGTINVNGYLKEAKTPSLGLNGNIQQIDLRKIIPQINLKQFISNETLLSKLNADHKAISVEGIVNGHFKLTTAGRTQNQMIASLNGNGAVDLTQGRVDNLNYEKLMCQGIAFLNRKQLTAPFNRNYTDFQKLSANIVIRNGVVTNNPLQMIVPGLSIHGQGNLNLNQMVVDYKAQATLTGDQSINPDPACQINENFKGIGIPVICEGSLENPSGLCRLDTAALGNVASQLIETKVKEKVNKELDQQKEKLQNKLEDKIGKELDKNPAVKGLLKGLL